MLCQDITVLLVQTNRIEVRHHAAVTIEVDQDLAQFVHVLQRQEPQRIGQVADHGQMVITDLILVLDQISRIAVHHREEVTIEVLLQVEALLEVAEATEVVALQEAVEALEVLQDLLQVEAVVVVAAEEDNNPSNLFSSKLYKK